MVFCLNVDLIHRLMVTLSSFWALVAFLYRGGRGRDCPWSRDPTRLHCRREHSPVRPMRRGWSTWITERRPNSLTLIASSKHLPASRARDKSLSSSQFVKKWCTWAHMSRIGFHLQNDQCPAAQCQSFSLHVHPLWVAINSSQEHNCSPAFNLKTTCVQFVTDLPGTRGHGDATQQREQDEQECRQPQVMHDRLE